MRVNKPSKTLTALLSLAALTIPQTAASAATSYFSYWYGEAILVEDNHATYTVDLGSNGDSGIKGDVDVQWIDTDDNNYVSIGTTFDEEEWLNAKTPFGKRVGSNFSDSEDGYFSVRTTTSSTITIDFSETIPAKQLVWAVSDIDVEDVVVTGSSDSDGPLSGQDLIGSATPRSFNFCDVSSDIPDVCAGEDTVPRVSVNADNVTAIPAISSSDEGETAWGIVNAAIDQLVISPEVVNSSSGSLRIWLAYSDTAIAALPNDEPLAPTGSTETANLWVGALAVTGLIAIGGAIALRRRA